MRLKGKVALITGASGGQGAAEARLFAEEGARVVITDIRHDEGRALADDIRAAGNDAVFLPLDVSSPEDWQGLLASIQLSHGSLHILVNNAGVIDRHGIANMPLDVWNRVFAINLTGCMLGMQTMAPLIRQSGGGSIVNVSSISGLIGHNQAAYSASKWALRGLTKTAAIEYVSWGIRVNSIHPAQIINTSVFDTALPGFSDAARETIPMQRQGTPEECALAALFLAGDESSFITGTEIPIDGGFSSCGAVWMRARMQKRNAAATAG